jgi:hypothetical protein
MRSLDLQDRMASEFRREAFEGRFCGLLGGLLAAARATLPLASAEAIPTEAFTSDHRQVPTSSSN